MTGIPWEHLPTVRTVAELEQYGVPEPIVRDKVEQQLADAHREWIAATPLVFVATVSADGHCDGVSEGRPSRLRAGARRHDARKVVRSHRPRLALVVTVDEVFFHCPKAFARSHTWKPESWEPTAV